MSLKFYDAYLKDMSKQPVDEWREITQEMINDTWNNTSTVETVNGQVNLGVKLFSTESVQLNSLVEPKTGKDFGDDFRKIIYKNYEENRLPPNVIPYSQYVVKDSDGVRLLKFTTNDGKDFLVRTNSKRFLGKYYQFDGYTWLTINTNTKIGAIATAILQRCNNKLRWYDKDGNYHEWDCVFERKINSTNIDWGTQGVGQIEGVVTIKVQRNEETNAIEFNQRFLFDNHAFQVKQINNHISDTYMELYAFEIQLQSNDDLNNDIANSSCKMIEQSNGSYILPKTNKILLGESQVFTVFNYINGVATGDTFSISVQGGINGVNYSLTVRTGNEFMITNLLESNEPLTIVCTNNNDKNDVVKTFITLGGGW